MTDLNTRGMAIRRRVLGAAHVNRAEAAKSDADAAFQALITDAAWGHVWARHADGLSGLQIRDRLTRAAVNPVRQPGRGELDSATL